MLSEEENKVIKNLENEYKKLEEQGNILFPLYKRQAKAVLNLITKLRKEIEHQKEKRENQKIELTILNEKQKEMNKLINDVKSYKGQFIRQEREIRELQKENEEKDKQIDLMTEEIEYAGCIKKVWECNKKDCKDCIKQYFEKLAKEKGK